MTNLLSHFKIAMTCPCDWSCEWFIYIDVIFRAYTHITVEYSTWSILFLFVLNISSSPANVIRNILLSVKAEKFTWRWRNPNATWIWWYPCLVCSLPVFILCISKFAWERDWQPYSFPDSIGDDLLVEVQDSKGKQFGRVLVQVATIADDPVIFLGPDVCFKYKLVA